MKYEPSKYTQGKYTVQCKHPDTGETGCWIYTGPSHRTPGSGVSPVLRDLVELYKWMAENNWHDAPGEWNSVELI